MMTDADAIALVNTKEPRDYDDAARDMIKVWNPSGYKFPTDPSFNRACGSAVQDLKRKTASN